MGQYGKSEYWQDRYNKDAEPFEWLQRYSALRELIGKHAKKDSEILNIGCGTSIMSEEMAEEGYTNILNIDTSEAAINFMQDRHSQQERPPTIKYEVMDALKMQIEDNKIDLIIDKATLDTILCSECSTSNLSILLSEVKRVLQPDGVYLVVSCSPPEQRLAMLQQEGQWKVMVEQVSKPTVQASITIQADDKDILNSHYVYICQPNQHN